MTDPPPAMLSVGGGHHLKPSSRRQYRLSDEQSPTRHRVSDDLIARLTPMTAVEMLRSPTGALKSCLDASSPSEQDFAVRTAIASQKILEWLDELSDWPWPTTGGPAGFEMPSAKRRKLSHDGLSSLEEAEEDNGDDGEEYMGSLHVDDVMRCERRVEEIYHGMEELQVEDIKSHVMHNHIMPLSRPGTPISDSNRSGMSSLYSYNKMDDLTAVVTAIVIQALPNLSKLCRLLDVWSIRLTVLRGIPALLSAISDAEIALHSGWNAISIPENASDADRPALTRQNFEVMKLVLQKKVSKPGRSMDYMLDSLEGTSDTLPDDWLDRLEAVERDYGEWVAVGERKIREAEWASMRTRKAATPETSTEPVEESRDEDRTQNRLPVVDQDVRTVTHPVPITIDPPAEDVREYEKKEELPSPKHSPSLEADVVAIVPSPGQGPVSAQKLPVVDDGDEANSLPAPVAVGLPAEQLATSTTQEEIEEKQTEEKEAEDREEEVSPRNVLPVVEYGMGTMTLPVPIATDLPTDDIAREEENSLSRSLNVAGMPESKTDILTPQPKVEDPQPDIQDSQEIRMQEQEPQVGSLTPKISQDLPQDQTPEESLAHARLQKQIGSHGRQISSYDGSEDVDRASDDVDTPEIAEEGEFDDDVAREEDDPTIKVSNGKAVQSDDMAYESPSPVEVWLHTPEEEDEEQSLPPLIHGSRRGSDASYTSTVIHPQSSRIMDLSSDMPEISASPPLPRMRDTGNRASPVSLEPVQLEDATRADLSGSPELPQLPDLDNTERPASPEFSRRRDNDEYAGMSPPSSPPFRASNREESMSPMVGPVRDYDDLLLPKSPLEPSFIEEDLVGDTSSVMGSPSKASEMGADDQLQLQISEILESIPANIKLQASPTKINLNPPPPDIPFQRLKRPSKDPIRRSASSLSNRAPTPTSRAATPSFTLAPAFTKNPRPRRQQGQQEIKVYHLSRSTGEAPIKLFIRLVGEHGERVMVRVGGGWADLGEYLKDYATHHGRRSQGTDASKIEIRDLPRVSTGRAMTSSPPSRPASALDYAPMTPLNVRKTRKSFGTSDDLGSSASKPQPNTPAPATSAPQDNTPPSEASTRSRSSSRLSWAEEDNSLLGLAGPTGKKVEMSEESRAWVESVKEKVRMASGERKPSEGEGRFGEIGKVGGTKRLFRKG